MLTRSLVLGAAVVSTLTLAGCGTTPASAGHPSASAHVHKTPPAPKSQATPAKQGLAALQWHIFKVVLARRVMPVGGPWTPVAVKLSITNPTGAPVTLTKKGLALWGTYPAHPTQPWTAFPYVGNSLGVSNPLPETPGLFPHNGTTSLKSLTLIPEVIPAHHTLTGWALLNAARGVKHTELVLLPHATANGAGTPIPIKGTAFSAP